MLNLLRYEFLSRRITVLGWGIGLALFGSMYVFIYPMVMEQIQGLADLELYRAMGIDIGSFAGFIASVVVQILPLILGVYMIMAGTGTLAGEEESGTLELVVALPLPRWQIVTVKALALMVASFVILAIIGGGTAIALELIRPTVETDVSAGQLFAAILGAWTLMVVTLAMSMFFAAILPSRRLALALMVMIYLASYLIKSVSSLVESLEGMRSFSIFNYVDTTANVFTQGVQASNVAVLLVAALIFFLLALWAFQGRNITVGQWPWRRRVMA